MNKILYFLILFYIIEMISCDKEKTDSVSFHPTEHNISKLGSKMRFVIKIPGKRFYNFSSNDSTLICEGNLCKDFLVSVSEMNELAQNLSDTIIFHWEIMTAESPYPLDHCELLIYGDYDQTIGENDYMCSIGSGNSAINILRELSKSFLGEAQSAFEEIISYLSN